MDQLHHLLLEKQHVKKNTLRDLILGGQDGLVNVLGIIFGVSAAGGSAHILIAAGLAATFAEAVSMGAVNYTSTLSDHDHYLKELSLEQQEIELAPDLEKEEIRSLYRAKGFEGELLEQIVKRITGNKTLWVETMMNEELRLQPVDTKDIFKSSLVVGVSTVIGSLIPLIPYFVSGSPSNIYFSIPISAVALYIVGVYQARSYVGSPGKKGLQMILIGLGAAVVGFVVGKFFNV
jgi:predicted membrane protein (TIGR00267 family)